jgi:hypothetical protein
VSGLKRPQPGEPGSGETWLPSHIYAVVHKHEEGDAMKLMTLSLAVAFAFSTSMALAKSKHRPHHIWRVPTFSSPNPNWIYGYGFDQPWLGPGQGIGGAGATFGPGGGNTPVTWGTQAFGANGMPYGPTNISGTGPPTSGAGGAAGGGGGGPGGGNR